jgi:hypothetical protein
VEVFGVSAGRQGQADDGVLVDADQAAGLADADALLEVGQDGDRLLLGETAVEQGGALALAEAVLAGAAGEQPALLGGAVAESDAEVALAPAAVVSAGGVLAAKVLEVVHGAALQKEGSGRCQHAPGSIENVELGGNISKTPPDYRA